MNMAHSLSHQTLYSSNKYYKILNLSIYFLRTQFKIQVIIFKVILYHNHKLNIILINCSNGFLGCEQNNNSSDTKTIGEVGY